MRIRELRCGHPADDLGADGQLARFLDMHGYGPERRLAMSDIAPFLRFIIYGPEIT